MTPCPTVPDAQRTATVACRSRAQDVDILSHNSARSRDSGMSPQVDTRVFADGFSGGLWNSPPAGWTSETPRL